MGQTLSEPVTEKHSEHGEDGRLMYGVSSMQGWRISMEDAHANVLDLKHDSKVTAESPVDTRISFFGVYDGHGGDKVAIYTGEHLHEIIAKQEAFKNGQMEKAIKDGFLATDKAILSDPRYEEEVSGCTACIGLVSKTKIWVGNAGDSRSVLGIKGRAKPMSFDHKPQNESERSRITAAGGFVDFGRVNGNLALSRAIGDFEFKKTAELPPEQQIVTAYPDVTEHELTEEDEFLVIACDGIWDCQTSQAVVEFVRRGIVAKQELSSICENLMDNCLARTSDGGGVGCDNMTVTVIALLNGKTKEEWYDMIGKRVADGDGPCAPPEYAEHRGPGVHHNNFEDHNDDMDMQMDLDAHHRNPAFSRLSRGIILLGDSGSFSSRQGADADMHDDDANRSRIIEEDQDLEPHMISNEHGSGEGTVDDEAEKERSRREETPAPQTVPGGGAAATENKGGDTLQPKVHDPSKEKATKEASEADAPSKA